MGPACEEIDCILLAGKDRLLRGGVESEPKDGEASLMESPSNDGIESLDSVRVDMTDSCPASLSVMSSSKSGGLSNTSIGLLPNDMLSFSSNEPCCKIASTVNFCAEPFLY